MQRRRFIQSSLAAASTAIVSGCVDGGVGGALQGSPFPTYDHPQYSEWVPTESTSEGSGVFFTHLNLEALNEEEDGKDAEETESGGDGSPELDQLTDEFPILALPIYGGVITPFMLFGILNYPFSDVIVPDEGEEQPEGIHSSSMTSIEDILAFHGEYDPMVFEEYYSDGFEQVEQREEFSVFVGDEDGTDGYAFAVSDEALVVGTSAGEDESYRSEERVSVALDRIAEESGRLIDDNDGEWLFETTGIADMSFGVWQTEDLVAALETNEEQTDAGEDVDEANPVFGDVESLVNNVTINHENGQTSGLESRFSGIYPDGAPSEENLRETLIGDEEVEHDIVIEENRAHVEMTLEDSETTES